MESSDDLINEQAWLIARGVRPLALLDSVDKNSVAMQRAFQHLIEKTIDPAIPFVLSREDIECAMMGFAGAQWVIDLLTWSYRYAPLHQHHRILGPLARLLRKRDCRARCSRICRETYRD